MRFLHQKSLRMLRLGSYGETHSSSREETVYYLLVQIVSSLLLLVRAFEKNQAAAVQKQKNIHHINSDAAEEVEEGVL